MAAKKKSNPPPAPAADSAPLEQPAVAAFLDGAAPLPEFESPPEGDKSPPGPPDGDDDDLDGEDHDKAPAPPCAKCTRDRACSLACWRRSGLDPERYAEHVNGPAKAGHAWVQVRAEGSLHHDGNEHVAKSWLQLPKSAALELSEANVVSATWEF